MPDIQEINWNCFKAKFNGKEQKSFEFLCYLLFCNEFNQKTGIFRYKNQAGIETEPIEHDGKIIGFQAKFYDTKISENVDDIKDSIFKAKNKNPNLDRILFYISQEFSESSKKEYKEPQYKIDIETFATSKKIEIEWRVPSHFERQLALESNKSLARHFFSLEKGPIDFVKELMQHTESILIPINSRIDYMGKVIKLDRSDTIRNLRKALKRLPIVVLSGEGGVGKTALIKDMYEQINEELPILIFKATEFNISNINSMFHDYGNFTVTDLVSEYQDIDEKYIIIDSAEKLSDLEHQEVFQEFLTTISNNKWKIIFTTRYSYLEDLKFQLVEVYHVGFQAINIEKIKIDDLIKLSNDYSFNLPQNKRLLELLQNPFYLSEYLLNYENINNTTSLSDFKTILWNKQIMKSLYRKNNIHIRREENFLKIAQIRANEGHFYVKYEGYDDEALQNLELDEIIKYDLNAGGYFITHDIYEEWALDKIIERSFIKLEDIERFFNSIGSSLPIRRAFRNWLSEKLLVDKDDVKDFINESLFNDKIETFWKDEIIVSVLLSEYSKVFFELFEEKLLENEQKLLVRVVFLLRIACKEIDESYLTLLGLANTNDTAHIPLQTSPKGNGWDSVISFINKHKLKFGNRNMYTILPMLADWNDKHIEGDVTKNASQIGLFYYENIVENGGFGHNDENKRQLIKVILKGTAEVKDELIQIFNRILERNEPSHRDRDYELVEVILTSIIDNYELIKNLPDYVIKLAELYWIMRKPKETFFGYDSSYGNEKYFGLSDKFHYFPPSALQTPVFQLLRYFPEKAINFILLFTNNAVRYYVDSEQGNELGKVKIFSLNSVVTQYISSGLWNMYRQGSLPLLESIHMALEKWLLEYVKIESTERFKDLCLYLIENSISTSITAVVTSVVLAYPSKLFDIAKILFRTKEFFLYDKSRMVSDQSIKSLYSIGPGLNFEHQVYQNERIKTCDDKHREKSLEEIALFYQFFKSEEESDKEVENRQKVIWGIFDEYYNELKLLEEENEFDKTWRLFLARMDRRKMKPKVEEVNEGLLIDFNPEIDPELEQYREESLRRTNEPMKYIQLQLWSEYRFRGDVDKYSQYQKYENNPQLALSEVKDIIRELENKTIDNFRLFNHSIPAYALAVLVRDFSDRLCLEEKEFCKEILIEYASLPLLSSSYSYQILDGTEPAIISLPYLCTSFPKENEEVKTILILLLLIDGQIATVATRAVLNSLWGINFEDAHSIFLGYLYIKPKYDDFVELIRKANYEKGVYQITVEQTVKDFSERYEEDIERIVQNKINYDSLGALDDINFKTLNTAFELLPLRTSNKDHMQFILDIFEIFSKIIFIDKHYSDEEKFDYSLKQRFFEKFAYFILTTNKGMVRTFIQPFVENFAVSRESEMLFHQFIYAENRLNQYEEFWIVWNAFYETIVSIFKKYKQYHYEKETLYSYLLAWPYWKETAREWHSLKERERMFYKKVADDLGHCPPVLYSISKILNDIGSHFLEDGIIWISGMINRNRNLYEDELEINTIYYIENIVRKYILTNRRKIKMNIQTKRQVITILNFLIERGSAIGYLLREDIL